MLFLNVFVPLELGVVCALCYLGPCPCLFCSCPAFHFVFTGLLPTLVCFPPVCRGRERVPTFGLSFVLPAFVMLPPLSLAVPAPAASLDFVVVSAGLYAACLSCAAKFPSLVAASFPGSSHFSWRPSLSAPASPRIEA